MLIFIKNQKNIQMKTTQIFLILCFLCSSYITSEAQFGRLKRKIKNKVNRKVEQKVDQKIDKEIDEAFENMEDAAEGDPDSKKKKRRKYDLSKIGQGPVELEESYNYDFAIDWEIVHDNGDPAYMTQLMTEDGKFFGMKIQDQKKKKKNESSVIFDTNRNYIIVLMEDDKQAMVTSFEPDLVANETESGSEEETLPQDFSFKATGQKKEILGYTCEQYIFTSDKTKGEMWMTKELNYSNRNMYDYFQKMSRKKGKTFGGTSWEKFNDGFALEVISFDEDGKKSIMLAKAVDKDADVKYKMSEYETINLTGMGGIMGN